MKQRKLILSLKTKWFEMIKEGVKKEEYREINEYWIKRFTNGTDLMADKDAVYPYNLDMSKFDEFCSLDFTLGYPKNNDMTRRLNFSKPSVRIDKGRTDWGAEADKLYFVITWKEK